MVTESFVLDVVGIVDETEHAKSISLAVPADVRERFGYRPGQFLTVAVPSEQTGVAARCYSLSSSPFDDGHLTFTVKRTVDGYASNWICDNVAVGGSLRVLPPSGIFTPGVLDHDLLLFAGGSGVTPIMSIARAALSQGASRVVVFYANRDQDSVIFAEALTALAAQHPERLQVIHWLESVQGLPTLAQIKAFASAYETYDAYVCGPGPFMDLVTGALEEVGFPRERRHQEKFVSLGGNPFDAPEEPEARPEVAAEDGPAGPVKLEVELDGEERIYDDWAPGTTLLDFLEKKGVQAPYSCREGACSACALQVLEGDVKMLRNDVLTKDDLDDGIRLGCQSVPVTDTVKVTYG